MGISKSWNKFMRKLKKIPRLFSKVIVVWCIICGTVLSVMSLRMFFSTGLDASNLLIPILAFFGGELALLFGKSAIGSKNSSTQEEYIDEEEE